MKKCPFCAEEIQDAAVVCKHCGRDLVSTATAQKVEVVQAKKRTGCFTWIALIFVVTFFLVILTNYCSSAMNPTTPPTKRGANAIPQPAAPATGSSPTATAASPDLLPFKVVARDSTAVILLVPASATEADLTNLVSAIRTARIKGTLATFFPPTTPKGSSGPYVAAAVFVMSDPVWATTPRLKAFSNPTTSGISAAEKEFGKRVRAYYFFTTAGQFQEFGTLGYEDEGHQYTATYKKLF